MLAEDLDSNCAERTRSRRMQNKKRFSKERKMYTGTRKWFVIEIGERLVQNEVRGPSSFTHTHYNTYLVEYPPRLHFA